MSSANTKLLQSLAMVVTATVCMPATADRLALSQACEIAVAKSALPARLRADASVYALVDGNYRKVVEGDGVFTCVVERNHPDSVIPQCMDQAGVDTVLPAIIDRSEMLVSGASLEEVTSTNQEKLHHGEYSAAARPGVNYMLSDYNYIYVSSAQAIMKVPPHVMFYAPGISNEDIGGSFQDMVQNIGTPFVFSEGPHGYMVTYSEHSADPAEVTQACADELGEKPAPFEPFAGS